MPKASIHKALSDGADAHNTSSSPAIHILSFGLKYSSLEIGKYIMLNIIEAFCYAIL